MKPLEKIPLSGRNIVGIYNSLAMLRVLTLLLKTQNLFYEFQNKCQPLKKAAGLKS